MKEIPMRIAILGCGPSGLVAAYAVERTGAVVHIFSKPRKSEMFGAQYLHRGIPGIPSGNPMAISYQLQGSIEDYRAKVYGPSYHGSVSPVELETSHLAWDIRHTYDQLWAIYGPAVKPAEITPSWLTFNIRDYDAVLSTIPLPAICVNSGHRFEAQEILAIGDAPERDQYVGSNIADGTVICNGRQHPSWYRASKIFGYSTLEWSLATAGAGAPSDASRVKKPLSTDCDCWPLVTRVGRYGKWKKGELVHHVYREAIACVAAIQ
jgi:hypothetical protein